MTTCKADTFHVFKKYTIFFLLFFKNTPYDLRLGSTSGSHFHNGRFLTRLETVSSKTWLCSMNKFEITSC